MQETAPSGRDQNLCPRHQYAEEDGIQQAKPYALPNEKLPNPSNEVLGTIRILFLFLPFLKVGEVEERTVVTDDNRVLLATRVKREPLMQEFIRLGTQFVGYHDYAKQAEENLAEANKRADTLARKLEQSEKARKKAEADAKEAKAEAATVEDLRKKLHEAETSLSEHISAQSAREEAIIKRLASQSRRFARKTGQEYELRDPENDPLLDALSLLEIHGDEARDGLAEAEAGLSQLFPTSSRRKNNPRRSLPSPSASILPKTLGSNFAKKV
ncbi:hypothetical protein QYE76_062320 [Lolium multiflorum]|uniref:Uncharacterized protein n=1 Tax=Lolium multiflorum TaxID=4521 RepID=A0AAD8S3J0_LOLMU|nr:hypothetical protein QYE76_062320 [Lolium multiflorum]